MPDKFPEFSSEQELIEWFERADLSAYELDEALEVVVSSRLGLSLEGPWSQAGNGGAATGTTGTIEHRAVAAGD